MRKLAFRSMRVAVVLVGVGLGLLGFWVAAIYGFIIGFGCNGTDAGQPPPSGSVGATLCDSPIFPVVLFALGLAALAAPIAGGVMARRRGYSSLWASAAVAAGALSVLGVLLHAVEGGTESVELFVGAPVLVCLGLAAVAIRQHRAERPH